VWLGRSRTPLLKTNGKEKLLIFIFKRANNLTVVVHSNLIKLGSSEIMTYVFLSTYRFLGAAGGGGVSDAQSVRRDERSRGPRCIRAPEHAERRVRLHLKPLSRV